MKKFLKRIDVPFVILGIIMITFAIVSMCYGGVENDSLGILGKQILRVFERFNLPASGALTVISILTMIVYRGIQIGLQSLPTKWLWINNKITLRLVDRILSWIFGKTTMCYNAQLDETAVSSDVAKQKLKDEIVKHLTRKGGYLSDINKAFNEAVKK